ncbi:hypothetical protein HMPREF0872_06555 [Veillonella montpellierensis DNF00314]|uniref:Uncharacterized protein n=1 Tax=Veillonella montpellierensis DNF00314 TaxID=1401067 RepID=A0A096AJ95_9FIRM|nr:hypothetical protein [Veillonella montpellierensis]KGF46895.1 hypothetical protein HMPREF0872_06555 [Veillonella montpellierensis DNF00314]
MKKRLIPFMVAACITVSTFGGMMTANAFNLGSLLGGVAKVGGVGFLVDRYSDSIDNFLNTLLRQNNLSTTYTTKVVPIVSVGNNAYIGAAQITGPASEIERVKAVAQLEASFNGIARVKGLVPIDSMNPVGANRIQGVGISALVDLKI